MDVKLDSVQLKYKKSTFIIDLMEHDNGLSYIAIEQTIHAEKDETIIRQIIVNPSALGSIIKVLTGFSKVISQKTSAINILSSEKKKEVIKRYFNSVDIKDLALQFSCSSDTIKKIIISEGIEIVSNKVPKGKKYWRKTKRKY